jgi:hypothetical protein
MNFAHAGRPFGRLIFFASLVLLFVGSAAPVHADISKTIVHDVIHRADGSSASGTLLISWPSFRTAQNDYVAAGSTTVDLADGGAFSVQLAPTDGGTPSGVQYRVVLQLAGASPEVQYWIVPAVAETGIHLGGAGSASGASRPPAADPQQFLLKAGDIMTGPLTLYGAPLDPAQAATKQYVDDAISPTATKAYVDDAIAPTATRQYVDAAIAPTATTQYVDSLVAPMASKQYVDTALAPTATTQYVDTSVAPLATRQYVDSSGGAPVVKVAGTCDNLATVNDTAAFQAALNALTGTGGTIYAKNCMIDGPVITWPTGKSINVEIEGRLILHSIPLAVPNNVHIKGMGGATPLQFQNAGPVANLYDYSSDATHATLRLIGTNAASLQDVTITNCAGPCLLIDGTTQAPTALGYMRNVGAQPNTGSATGTPLVVDSAFWYWFDHCVFLTSSGNLPYSVRLTKTVDNGIHTGLVFFDQGVWSGYGALLDSQVSTDYIGNFYFKGVLLENSRNAQFRFDVGKTSIINVGIDYAGLSDSVVASSSIELINNTAGGVGRLRNLTLFNVSPDSGRPTIARTGAGATDVQGLLYTSGRMFQYTTGWTPDAQLQYSSIHDGLFDGAWYGYGQGSIPLIPYASLNVGQDCSSFTVTPGVVDRTSSTVLAPDGSTTACTFSTTTDGSGTAMSQPAIGSLAVGDVIIAGVWVRSEVAGKPVNNGLYGRFSFPQVNNKLKYSNSNELIPLADDTIFRYDDGWMPVVYFDKVTAAGTPSTSLDMTWKLRSGYPVSLWKPWAIRIPASAGISDAEIMRWLRYVSRANVVSTVPGGNYALHSHQKMYFGTDTYIGRGSASGKVAVNGVDVSTGSGGLSLSTTGQGYFWGVAIHMPASNTNTSAVTVANNVHVVQFVLPWSQRVSKITGIIGVQSSGSQVVGIYDATGNKLLQSAAMSLNSTSGNAVSGNISAVTLPAGVYYLAWSATDTTGGFTTSNISNYTQFFNNGTVRMGTCANTMSSNVLPATCGAITFANKSYPLVLFEP